MNPNHASLSASRRQTVNRIKLMVAYHFENVSSELRPTDWQKLNRVSPTNLSYALSEMVIDGLCKRGSMYQVAGPHGYESHQSFVRVAPVAVEVVAEPVAEVHPNVAFLDWCAGTYEVAA